MIKRLTHRSKYGIAYTKIAVNESNMVDVGECYTGRIVDRLAGYEDSGLTPEQVAEEKKYLSELKERARIEQAIRDLQLYIDVKWGGRNDMLNLALAALKDFCKLQAENEQLQAQVARMREALRKAREAIKAAWSDGSANAAMDKASEALAEIDKAIGGKGRCLND